MKYQPRMILIVALVMMMAGCDRGHSTPSRAESMKYGLKGVVRKVDEATGDVTISHEDIAGFMPKMTMPFAVKPRSLLQGVNPGDEVEGTLWVDREAGALKELYLTELKVVKAGTPPVETPAEPGEGVPRVLQPGDLVPDFTMTTEDGKTLKLDDLRGKVIVLSFIYTRCPSPDFCPAIDGKFAELAKRISTVAGRAEHVRLLSVSFDPEHDTPEVLKAHAARRGAKPPLWMFLVASHEELSKVAGSLGLTYVPGTREIDHNLRTALIGPDGRLVALERGTAWTPTELLKRIYAEIPKVGK